MRDEREAMKQTGKARKGKPPCFAKYFDVAKPIPAFAPVTKKLVPSHQIRTERKKGGREVTSEVFFENGHIILRGFETFI